MIRIHVGMMLESQVNVLITITTTEVTNAHNELLVTKINNEQKVNIYSLTVEVFGMLGRHTICYDYWKFYLSILSRDLDIELKHVPLNETESILLGIRSYYSMEYNKSLYHLQHALKENYNCKDSLDPVAHIILHSIYTLRDDLKSANESLAAITRTHFQCSSVVCYQDVYRNLVIPYLLSVNQTQLAEDLRQLLVKCLVDCEDYEIECRNSLLYSYARYHH